MAKAKKHTAVVSLKYRAILPGSSMGWVWRAVVHGAECVSPKIRPTTRAARRAARRWCKSLGLEVEFVEEK